MHIKKYLTMTIVFALVSSTIALAQEKPQEKPDEKPVFSFDGIVFFNWNQKLTDEGPAKKGDGNYRSTFQFERVYLNFKTKINEIWSTRVTVDFGTADADNRTYKVTDPNQAALDKNKSDSKYAAFLKLACAQAEKSFGSVDAKVAFGMIDTPVSGFVDFVSDQRWIHRNFVDNADLLLKTNTASTNSKDYTGQSIDNTADMGVSLSLKIMKKIEFVGAYSNGEGFKKANETNYSGDNDGKSYAGRLTVNPIDQLFISGYYRFNGNKKDEMKSNTSYYGGGIAWADTMLRAGCNYLVVAKKVDDQDIVDKPTGEKYNMYLVDAWLNVYLAPIINVPAFAMSRFGYGDTGVKDGTTTFWGAGLGYELDSRIRTVFWYEQSASGIDTLNGSANPNRMITAKVEIKL